MATNARTLVDDSDQLLERVSLGRNRLLRTLGVTLFGAALTLFVPQRAGATHLNTSPCFGAGRCHDCTPYCGCTGCTPAYNVGCPNGSSSYNCWVTCNRPNEPRLRQCCDYYDPDGTFCICDCDAGPC